MFLPQLVLGLATPFVAFGHPTAIHQGPAVRPQASHQLSPTNLRRWLHKPYSGGYLYAHAVRMGWIRPQSRINNPAIHVNLKCAHAPCTFPNENASGVQSLPVDETPIATSLVHPNFLLTGGNDYNCSTLLSFDASKDGGLTWNRQCNTLISGGGDGDPIVGIDLNNVAYRGGIDSFSNGTSGIVVGHSSDRGATWSAPVQAVTQEFSGGMADKPWLQVDTSPSSPHTNALYVSVTQFDPNSNSDISVSHSYDGGATWTTVSTGNFQNYPVVNQFSDIAVGKDGTLYVDFIRCTANGPAGDCGGTSVPIMLIKSTDGGNTWSSPVQIETLNFAPDTGCGFYGCVPNTNERLSNVPAIAIDNSGGANAGALYVSGYNYTGAFCQVVVVQSHDGGSTWSSQVAVAPPTETHDQFYPWLTVSNFGAVGVSWMDRRNDPSNFSWEEFGAASLDGGVTYPNVQLAANPSNPNNDGFGDGFIGDYTGNAWVNGKLYATWTDTSTGPPSSNFLGGLRVPGRYRP